MHLPYGGSRHTESDTTAPALMFDDVCVTYPGSQRHALCNVTACAQLGSRVALLGPNGSGKSTFLKVAIGLLPIDGGSVRVFGQPVGTAMHRIAFLAQRSEIDWRFPISLRRLVATGRHVHLGWLRQPGRGDIAIVDLAIERLGLTDLADRQIGQLSGGQQQRALLARALAQEADLLLLDEPLNAVDAATRDIMTQTIRDLHAAGKTVIVATHLHDDLEFEYDAIIRLSAGTIVQDRAPATASALPVAGATRKDVA